MKKIKREKILKVIKDKCLEIKIEVEVDSTGLKISLFSFDHTLLRALLFDRELDKVIKGMEEIHSQISRDLELQKQLDVYTYNAANHENAKAIESDIKKIIRLKEQHEDFDFEEALKKYIDIYIKYILKKEDFKG